MSSSQKRLAQLRGAIPEVDPARAHALVQEGAILVDVREPDEVAQGSPAAATRLVRGFLELRIEALVADKARTVLVMCAGGARSLFAAENLTQIGYTDVRSVAGGFDRWKQEGLPFEVPRVLDQDQRERFGRHLTMPEVGEAGQRKLLDAKVLMIGAGGLGSPAAMYLAAAGVGRIGVVDDDVVDRSNLQRQILHRDDRVGRPKTDSARETLMGFNPRLDFVGYQERLNSTNVERIFAGYDIVVDGCDNFPTRYLVNDACVRMGIPNVYGSIFRFEGQVSVFWPGHEAHRGPCYRCLYPSPPPPELAPSCAEAGVLGVLPGIIGAIEAVEAIKVILGVGEPLIGRLLHYDALGQRMSEFEVHRDPNCAWCSGKGQAPELIDYERFCSLGR
jgi:molybdopterin/thiamine biosynthesis adenylyltransferase/rhodanese-related sulfurtransferase